MFQTGRFNKHFQPQIGPRVVAGSRTSWLFLVLLKLHRILELGDEIIEVLD